MSVREWRCKTGPPAATIELEATRWNRGRTKWKYVRVRRADGGRDRERLPACGLHRDTVRKMLEYSVPPGLSTSHRLRRPKLVVPRGDRPDTGRGPQSPRKQRHTAKRIYDRLRAETGSGKPIVKDYVRERRRRTREMYVPLIPEVLVMPSATSARPRRSSEEWSRPSTTSCWTFPTATRASSSLPRGDDRGVLRRSRLGVLVPGRRAAEHRLRQTGCGQDGRRPAPAYSCVLGAVARGGSRFELFGLSNKRKPRGH